MRARKNLWTTYRVRNAGWPCSGGCVEVAARTMQEALKNAARTRVIDMSADVYVWYRSGHDWIFDGTYSERGEDFVEKHLGAKTVKSYRITSKAGVAYGTYEGATESKALLAMYRDAGYAADTVWIDPDTQTLAFADAQYRHDLGAESDWRVVAAV